MPGSGWTVPTAATTPRTSLTCWRGWRSTGARWQPTAAKIAVWTGTRNTCAGHSLLQIAGCSLRTLACAADRSLFERPSGLPDVTGSILPIPIAERGIIPCLIKWRIWFRRASSPSTRPVRLTPAAYTQLNLIVQRRGLKKRRLLTLALAVGVTLIYCILTNVPVSTTILLMVTEALVVLPVSFLMDKWFLKLYAKRSQKLSPAALDEQLFEFYEDGFRVVSGNSTDGFVRYNRIVSLARTDDYLALFITDVYAYLVMGDAADCGMQELTEFLQRKMNGKTWKTTAPTDLPHKSNPRSPIRKAGLFLSQNARKPQTKGRRSDVSGFGIQEIYLKPVRTGLMRKKTGRLSQIGRADAGIGEQAASLARADDLAGGQHIAVIGDLQGLGGVLLYQQDRHAGLVHLADDREDLVHQNGSQTHGGFVQQEHLRAGHECPSHGKHLLFAAGQGARHLSAALLQPGEALVHIRDAVIKLRRGAGEGSHLQVFLHRHLEEDLPGPPAPEPDPW